MPATGCGRWRRRRDLTGSEARVATLASGARAGAGAPEALVDGEAFEFARHDSAALELLHDVVAGMEPGCGGSVERRARAAVKAVVDEAAALTRSLLPGGRLSRS